MGNWLRVTATFVTIVAFGSACAGNQSPAAEIRGMIDDVWTVVGVDRDIVHVNQYFRDYPRSSSACAHLDRDDRWYAGQGSSIPPGKADPEAVEERIVDFLEAERFGVDLYRSTQPDSDVRRFWATRGRMVVHGTFNADGATSVHVRSGPCAPFFGGFDPDLYELDTTQ